MRTWHFRSTKRGANICFLWLTMLFPVQKALVSFAFLTALLHPIIASGQLRVYEEQGQLIRAGANVTALGSDLMGDRVNPFNGSLEFVHTDVALPGNSALPVSIGRRFAAGRQQTVSENHFVDWELDIPYLRGVYSGGGSAPVNGGWIVPRLTSTDAASRLQRCSRYRPPPSVFNARGATWDADQFWSGNSIHIPGVGDEKMLKRAAGNSAAPTDGYSYGVVTRSNWQFRCITGLASPYTTSGTETTGEGFIALSPDGTTYRFDWMVTRSFPGITTSAGAVSRQEVTIFPTVVTDRYGNTVTYVYDTVDPWKLLRIVASDGRTLTITYGSGRRVASVSDGSRTWTYGYGTVNVNGTAYNALTSVALPDGTSWQFNLLERFVPRFSPDGGCYGPGGAWQNGQVAPSSMTSTVVHPSGATGSFTLASVAHGRAWYLLGDPCLSGGLDPDDPARPEFAYRSLLTKTLSGPGVTPLSWSYAWGPSNGVWVCNASCAGTKTVTLTDARGFQTRYTFGIRVDMTEGQLQRIEEGWNGSSAQRTTTLTYRASNAGPYPDPPGYSGSESGDDWMQTRHTPLSARTVNQQGINFTWQANAFDTFARLTSVTRSSSLGTRTENTAYSDNSAKWVLGQIASITEQSTSAVMVSNGYDPSTANLISVSKFGKLQQTFSYYGDGTVYQRGDGAGRLTTFSNYKRGLAQNVTYADSRSESASINDIGLVSSMTDPNGYTTSYGYDAIGRLNFVSRPTGDTVAWNSTTLTFQPVGADEYGLSAGHWRQTVATGNARRITYFDALWRPVLTKEFDAASPSNTGSDVLRRFDADGRMTFQSYPARGIASISSTPPGTANVFDVLGRLSQTAADSELGSLITMVSYLSGFQKRVTNPRSQVTTTSYQAFDEPREDAIVAISAPEGVNVSIPRDVFGKALSVTRGGSYGGGTLSATRSYVYDANQRLCKTIEPEIGATVVDYDTANNIAWRASGQNLLTLSCDRASVPAAAKVTYGYDLVNRLLTTSYGDGSAGITRTYTPDGLLATVNSDVSSWTYGYNRLRRLTAETLVLNGVSYQALRSYDANGSLSQVTYPDGGLVAFAPNALGQPSQAGSYANSVSWHPNGAVAGYTLGNGIAHSLTQTTRGLPLVNRDGGVMQDLYSYDAAGNVASITDQQEGLTTRSLGYDGLDRLTTANASALWGSGTYAYDPLDNLRSYTLGTSTVALSYDTLNRLSLLTINGGSTTGFAYDATGNITGRGTQGYYFDLGNRMTLANGFATYRYDGLGRRTTIMGSNGVSRTQMYSQTGQLLYATAQQGMSTWNTRFVYLGDKQIAETTNGATQYVHTDALGSPVARTDAAGQILGRTRYEPYGKTAAGTNPGSNGLTGIGFTGHVNDADTALVYMQQRYYDPLAARFMSIDPVMTNPRSGGSFNRYEYANSSPYVYMDPDGRLPLEPVVVRGSRIESGFGSYSVSRGSGSTERRVRLVSAGAFLGGVAGNVAAAACAGITYGVCAAGYPGVVGLGIAGGGLFGSWLANIADRIEEGADSEDKPSLLDPKGEQHILDGDKTGGGHRPGTGKPGKSEFPSGWSDDRIKGEISDVATDPASSRSPGRNGRDIVRGTRGGVDIEVIVEPNGRIVTGYPTNVPRNPR